MPFVQTLNPAVVNSANSANWDLGGGASDIVDALDTQGDGKEYGRRDPTDPDGGNAAASVYVDALPAYIRRITESATAPPVRVRGWWRELNPSGPMTAFHGIGYSASTDLSSDLSVSGGTFYEETAHDVAQNPSGPRDWDIADFPGGSAGAYLVISAQRALVLDEGTYCDHVRAEVRFERNQQASIYDLVAPWLPLAAALGGLAHARLDMRRLEAWVWRTAGRVGWTADEDAALLRELRDLRWPRAFDLGVVRS